MGFVRMVTKKAHDEANHWFLRKILTRLLAKNQDLIVLGRYVMKNPLYSDMAVWFRLSRKETRHLLRLLTQAYPGIVFSNRGLMIPKLYLDPIFQEPYYWMNGLTSPEVQSN